MAKESLPAYLPGEDPEAVEANRAYQDALRKLTESLDQRKNRFFDPRYLAAAQGFLAPGAPNFFESLGRAAGNVGKAEEAMIKEDQDIAQQKLAVAGQRLEMLRQREADKQMAGYLSGRQPAPGPLSEPARTTIAGPSAAAEGQPQGALSSFDGEESGVYGVQIAPPDPNRMTGRKYIELNRFDRSKSRADLIKEAANIDRQNIEVRESGKFNPITGMFYAFPTGKVEEVQIFGEDNRPAGTYKVDAVTAAQLSHFARTNDPRYWDLARRVIEGPQRRQAPQAPQVAQAAPQAVQQATAQAMPRPAPQAGPQAAPQGAPVPTPQAAPQAAPRPVSQAAPQVAPQAAPQAAALRAEVAVPPAAAAPSRLKSEQERKAEEIERDIEVEGRKARTKKLEEAAAEKEGRLEENLSAARRVYGSSTRVLDLLKQSPNAYGIFARPGAVAAIGNLINEAIQTPQGTIKLAGFEDSMRKVMPGIKQKDLDNVTKAAAEIAEIELAFTRLYLEKQGAVTEGERKIVRAIPGSVSNSAGVLRTRMEILKARSQYDIDVADAFRDWQDKNPGRSYLEFERKSQLYKDIKKGFEEESERIFGGMRAIPTRERGQAAPAASAAPAVKDRTIIDSQTGMRRMRRQGE